MNDQRQSIGTSRRKYPLRTSIDSYGWKAGASLGALGPIPLTDEAHRKRRSTRTTRLLMPFRGERH